MELTHAKYGLGIDSATGVIFDTHKFPYDWQKLGPGNIYLFTKKRGVGDW